MPVNNETINKNLYDVLSSRGYDPVPLDSKGDPTDEIEMADVFRFTYKDIDRRKKGQAWATTEGNELVLYIDDAFTKNPEFEGFTKFMKSWAQKRLLGFKITNKDHLIGDMKKRTVMRKKEDLNEGYYALGKKSSYSDSVPTVKMIIQHTRQIEEGEQRYRNVAKIFVENSTGERFLVPTNRPGLARVYARHIAEGGTPYDDKGKHITSLIEEYTKMAGFVRATRNGQFNESAIKLVNEGLLHYNNLRMTLQGMTGHRGYNKYFESYTPMLNEETDDTTTINELFVQEKLDPRIESVLPILNRLNKNITEMSEVKELEEWAADVTGEQVAEMFHGGFGGQSKFTKTPKPKKVSTPKNDEVKQELKRLKNLLLSGDEAEKDYARNEIARLKELNEDDLEDLEEGLGKYLVTGAALIAALWGINQHEAEKVYAHSKQLQQLEQFHTQALQSGDQAKAKELEDRIKNHKARLELGYGDVKGKTGEPRDVVYEVNEKQIYKDLDSGMSIDAVIGKHANKKLTNTDEIRKIIKQHAWDKRTKKQGVEEGINDIDTTGYTKDDMVAINHERNQIKKIQAKLVKIPGFVRQVKDTSAQFNLAEKIFNLMKRGHTFDSALVLAQKQGVEEGKTYKDAKLNAPRSPVAKNAPTSGAGAHTDKSKVIPRKQKYKNKDEQLDEGTMVGGIFSNDHKEATAALAKLQQITSLPAKNADRVMGKLVFDDELFDIIAEYQSKKPDIDLMKVPSFVKRLKYLSGWASSELEDETMTEGDVIPFPTKKMGISDELAAKKIAAKVMGVPDMDIPKLKSYIVKYLPMVGKSPKDVEHLTALVYDYIHGVSDDEAFDDILNDVMPDYDLKPVKEGPADEPVHPDPDQDDKRFDDIDEDLDANQKRVGQLGPTEKVKNNNIGKLVGANESVELERLKSLSGIK